MITKHPFPESGLPTADFCSTESWVTYALITNERFSGNILEPACGEGKMVEILKSLPNTITSCDLYPRDGRAAQDFLERETPVSNVITNPPFSKNMPEHFIEAAKHLTINKYAFLLPLEFMQGVKRWKKIFSLNPPARIYILSSRAMKMRLAWYVWDKDYVGETTVKWIAPEFRKYWKELTSN